MRLRKTAVLRALLGVVALVLLLVGWTAGLQLTDNFHATLPGEYYRSAQMDGAALRQQVRAHGIRSVINLRGAKPGQPWYEDEVAAAHDLGIAHFDFRMTATRHLDQNRAAELLALLKAAPKPVLVHCQSGADRTGLASSLYLAAVAGMGEARAERQLSLRYGHFSVPVLSAAWPMDESWEALEPWLGFTDS